MTRVAVIAAMDRELRPLVAGWTKKSFHHAGTGFRYFEHGDCVAVAGGIGCGCSARVARAVIEVFRPRTVISTGLAGGLVPGLRAGTVVHPHVVVDAATGTEYGCRLNSIARGGGVLVSSDEVAGPESKDQLAQRFHALVVDMEAAGVAKVAQELGTGFCCVKAVSDEYDDALPPLNRFVGPEGVFRVGRFGVWVALRPWRWPATFRLARNTSRATGALSDWLGKNLNDNLPGPTVVTLRSGYFENANANRQQS
jgi:nucleoside phosphorylase